MDQVFKENPDMYKPLSERWPETFGSMEKTADTIWTPFIYRSGHVWVGEGAAVNREEHYDMFRNYRDEILTGYEQEKYADNTIDFIMDMIADQDPHYMRGVFSTTEVRFFDPSYESSADMEDVASCVMELVSNGLKSKNPIVVFYDTRTPKKFKDLVGLGALKFADLSDQALQSKIVSFHVDSCEKMWEKFTPTEGADPDTTQSTSLGLEGDYTSIESLSNALGLPDDLQYWFAFNNRIQCSVLEDDHGMHVKSGDHDYTEWEAGRTRLWLADYSFWIDTVELENGTEVNVDKMKDSEAEQLLALGIGIKGYGGRDPELAMVVESVLTGTGDLTDDILSAPGTPTRLGVSMVRKSSVKDSYEDGEVGNRSWETLNGNPHEYATLEDLVSTYHLTMELDNWGIVGDEIVYIQTEDAQGHVVHSGDEIWQGFVQGNPKYLRSCEYCFSLEYFYIGQTLVNLKGRSNASAKILDKYFGFQSIGTFGSKKPTHIKFSDITDDALNAPDAPPTVKWMRDEMDSEGDSSGGAYIGHREFVRTNHLVADIIRYLESEEAVELRGRIDFVDGSIHSSILYGEAQPALAGDGSESVDAWLVNFNTDEVKAIVDHMVGVGQNLASLKFADLAGDIIAKDQAQQKLKRKLELKKQRHERKVNKFELPQGFVGFSVSHGTLDIGDLIGACVYFLRHYAPIVWEYIATYSADDIKEWEEAVAVGDESEYWGDESANYFLEHLEDWLNTIAPKNTYFGANEGDGSDMGFWSVPDNEIDAEGSIKFSVTDSANGMPEFAAKAVIGQIWRINDYKLYNKDAYIVKEPLTFTGSGTEHEGWTVSGIAWIDRNQVRHGDVEHLVNDPKVRFQVSYMYPKQFPMTVIGNWKTGQVEQIAPAIEPKKLELKPEPIPEIAKLEPEPTGPAVGTMVTAIATDEELAGLANRGEVPAHTGQTGIVDSVLPSLASPWRRHPQYVGVVMIKSGEDHTWYVPYSDWQKFISLQSQTKHADLTDDILSQPLFQKGDRVFILNKTGGAMSPEVKEECIGLIGTIDRIQYVEGKWNQDPNLEVGTRVPSTEVDYYLIRFTNRDGIDRGGYFKPSDLELVESKTADLTDDVLRVPDEVVVRRAQYADPMHINFETNTYWIPNTLLTPDRLGHLKRYGIDGTWICAGKPGSTVWHGFSADQNDLIEKAYKKWLKGKTASVKTADITDAVLKESDYITLPSWNPPYITVHVDFGKGVYWAEDEHGISSIKRSKPSFLSRVGDGLWQFRHPLERWHNLDQSQADIVEKAYQEFHGNAVERIASIRFADLTDDVLQTVRVELRADSEFGDDTIPAGTKGTLLRINKPKYRGSNSLVQVMFDGYPFVRTLSTNDIERLASLTFKSAVPDQEIFISIPVPKSVRKKYKHVEGLEDDLHITLVFVPDAETSEARQRAIVKAVAGVCRDSVPFTCQFTGLGSFDNSGSTFAALVNIPMGAELVVALEQAVEKKYGQWKKEFGYLPHVTLNKKGDGETDIEDLRDFKWTCDEIRLCFSDPADHYWMLPLGGGEPKEVHTEGKKESKVGRFFHKLAMVFSQGVVSVPIQDQLDYSNFALEKKKKISDISEDALYDQDYFENAMKEIETQSKARIEEAQQAQIPTALADIADVDYEHTATPKPGVSSDEALQQYLKYLITRRIEAKEEQIVAEEAESLVKAYAQHHGWEIMSDDGDWDYYDFSVAKRFHKTIETYKIQMRGNSIDVPQWVTHLPGMEDQDWDDINMPTYYPDDYSYDNESIYEDENINRELQENGNLEEDSDPMSYVSYHMNDHGGSGDYPHSAISAYSNMLNSMMSDDKNNPEYDSTDFEKPEHWPGQDKSPEAMHERQMMPTPGQYEMFDAQGRPISPKKPQTVEKLWPRGFPHQYTSLTFDGIKTGDITDDALNRPDEYPIQYLPGVIMNVNFQTMRYWVESEQTTVTQDKPNDIRRDSPGRWSVKVSNLANNFYSLSEFINDQLEKAYQQYLHSHRTPFEQEYTTEWIDPDRLASLAFDTHSSYVEAGSFYGWIEPDGTQHPVSDHFIFAKQWANKHPDQFPRVTGAEQSWQIYLLMLERGWVRVAHDSIAIGPLSAGGKSALVEFLSTQNPGSWMRVEEDTPGQYWELTGKPAEILEELEKKSGMDIHFEKTADDNRPSGGQYWGWISPSGEFHELEGYDTKFHALAAQQIIAANEQYAKLYQPDKETGTEFLLRMGWIRVNQGVNFDLSRVDDNTKSHILEYVAKLPKNYHITVTQYIPETGASPVLWYGDRDELLESFAGKKHEWIKMADWSQYLQNHQIDTPEFWRYAKRNQIWSFIRAGVAVHQGEHVRRFVKILALSSELDQVHGIFAYDEETAMTGDVEAEGQPGADEWTKITFMQSVTQSVVDNGTE
jgi:2'-5' RNA ligase